MKTIIATTDFSSSSTNACKYAAFLATKLKCRLTVFNLFETPLIHSNMGMYGISFTSQKSESQQKSLHLVELLRNEFPKLKIDCFITGGSFKEQLEEFTARHLVEAVVTGLKSKEKISKFVYGTHGVKIAGKINAPVIVVPDNYRDYRLSNIVLAVDNQEKLRRTSLVGLGRFLKQSLSRLRVLHVHTPSEFIKPETHDVRINSEKLPIEIINAADMESGVKKYCTHNDTDLVVVLGRKHSVFYNLFSESNTKRIIFFSKVPVMTIHE
jgi:nucleotide-binding universal stress UspA family protein